MASESMVERVAFGVYTKRGGDEWADLLEDEKDVWRTLARAAIEAMREPTEVMVLADNDDLRLLREILRSIVPLPLETEYLIVVPGMVVFRPEEL